MALPAFLIAAIFLAPVAYGESSYTTCPAFETGETYVGSLRDLKYDGKKMGSLLARHFHETPWACCHKCEATEAGCAFWSWIARGRDKNGNLKGECAFYSKDACDLGSGDDLPFDPTNMVAYSGSTFNCRHNEATKTAKLETAKSYAKSLITHVLDSALSFCPAFETDGSVSGSLIARDVNGAPTLIDDHSQYMVASGVCSVECRDNVDGCTYWTWVPNTPGADLGTCFFFNQLACSESDKTFNGALKSALTGKITLVARPQEASREASTASLETTTAAAVVEDAVTADNELPAATANAESQPAETTPELRQLEDAVESARSAEGVDQAAVLDKIDAELAKVFEAEEERLLSLLKDEGDSLGMVDTE